MNAEFNAIENSPLMRKTKTQLVEIILRKDEVEKELREAIKTANNDFSTFDDKFDTLTKEREYIEKEYKKLDSHFNVLKNNYEDMCDEHITSIEVLKNKAKSYKRLLGVSVTMWVALFALLWLIYNV